jgi:hypothetical protein
VIGPDGTAALILIAAIVAPFAAAAFLVAAVIVVVKLVRRVLPREASVPVAQAAAARPLGITTPVRAVSVASAQRTAPALPEPPRGGGEDEALACWRYRQLLALGVDPLPAAEAALAGVDSSAVRSLVRRGCPLELALRLVEPVASAAETA